MIEVTKFEITTPLDDDTYGLTSLGEGLDDHFARLVKPHDELVVYVHNKMSTAREARQREGNILGKLWNRVFKEDSEHVVIEGISLRQMLDLTGEEASEDLQYNFRYQVGYADLMRLKEEAERVLTHKQEDAVLAFKQAEAKRAARG